MKTHTRMDTHRILSCSYRHWRICQTTQAPNCNATAVMCALCSHLVFLKTRALSRMDTEIQSAAACGVKNKTFSNYFVRPAAARGCRFFSGCDFCCCINCTASSKHSRTAAFVLCVLDSQPATVLRECTKVTLICRELGLLAARCVNVARACEHALIGDIVSCKSHDDAASEQALARGRGMCTRLFGGCVVVVE